MAEALAVRQAASFALDEGYHKVLIQSDCLAWFNALVLL
jgi:hypothetical protein